ncbi:hypothetical protein B5X24_HaOG204797 [Helicoverpa armigera]|uniref:Uncharacterized protein n=1 Tax=Helicoverpa armigera TaxID=29058 RepID=A0A2W1BRP5_HELAM|nr:hypothetical protein B5X24_HaOG204797 [Helicoverpa armigera]
MEAIFNDLQKQGKNNVDNLVKWFKDAKIIDQSKEQEEKLRSFFADVPDKKNVAMDKFKEVLGKVTEEFKKNAEVVAKQLAESGPKVLQSVKQAATSAIKDLIPKF